MWVGGYALGFVVTLYLCTRFGGQEMREYHGISAPADYTPNGLAVFFAIIWPMYAIAIVLMLAMAIAFSPVLIPVGLLWWFLWRRMPSQTRDEQ